MCNNVSQPFIPLPLHFSPFFIMFPNSCFKCISLLYNAHFSPEIVHLLTSSHFHCFTQPLLTSSSTAFPTLLLHNSLCFWCICLCILLSYAPFFPLFVLSLSLRFFALFSSYCYQADCSSALPSLCQLDQGVGDTVG